MKGNVSAHAICTVSITKPPKMYIVVKLLHNLKKRKMAVKKLKTPKKPKTLYIVIKLLHDLSAVVNLKKFPLKKKQKNVKLLH